MSFDTDSPVTEQFQTNKQALMNGEAHVHWRFIAKFYKQRCFCIEFKTKIWCYER